MKLVSLADVVGHGRDELVAAWCICILDDEMRRGRIEGPEIEMKHALEIVERCMAAGDDPPTDYEIAVGLVFTRAAHPAFRLTGKGKAAACFSNLFKDAGHG